ncbi:hypothetical protein [Algicella marina]|uniref:Uncharacterized protein n=1 Tax=Algicella marina TaxID=2683284 RepID=A0A6P1SVN6_9RHOB|nr:hypothetical protein [Algicella marina]QHQ34744.1 hypothetical protein GO499_05820 [Algicella marina]
MKLSNAFSDQNGAANWHATPERASGQSRTTLATFLRNSLIACCPVLLAACPDKDGTVTAKLNYSYASDFNAFLNTTLPTGSLYLWDRSERQLEIVERSAFAGSPPQVTPVGNRRTSRLEGASLSARLPKGTASVSASFNSADVDITSTAVTLSRQTDVEGKLEDLYRQLDKTPEEKRQDWHLDTAINANADRRYLYVVVSGGLFGESFQIRVGERASAEPTASITIGGEEIAEFTLTQQANWDCAQEVTTGEPCLFGVSVFEARWNVIEGPPQVTRLNLVETERYGKVELAETFRNTFR